MPELDFNPFLQRYEFYCTYDERMIPKAAGFLWDKSNHVWYTKFTQHADTLLNYATTTCKDKLNEDVQLILDDTPIPCPEGLRYLPYQEDGIRFLLHKPAALLADEMGLGKSIQAIGLVNASPQIRDALIIVPASLKLNWYREFNKWLVRKPSIRVLHSKSLWSPNGINIINYDILHKFPVERYEWDLLVCDEAHYLKSSKSQRTKKVVSINAKKKVLLTGTPILNRPLELWPLIHYLEPDVWKGKYYMFQSRYCHNTNITPEEFKSNGGKGASNLSELHQRLARTIMIRRTKKEVLKDLPAKRRVILEIPADDLNVVLQEELAEYQHKVEVVRKLKEAADKVKEASDLDAYRRAVLELGRGKRQILSDIAVIRHRTALAKVPYVVQHIEDLLEETEKLVVFAHHKDVIQKIQDAFPGRAVKFVGDMHAVQRQEAVDKFQTDSNTILFVGSIRAAGVGITLTAASNLVFAELDWVPGIMSQCEDRCHRIGQKSSLLVQHLVLSGSLDAYISEVLVKKQDILDQVLDGKAPVIVEEDILSEVSDRIRK